MTKEVEENAMADNAEPQKTTTDLFLNPADTPVRVTRSDRYAAVYSNNAQVGMSFYDMRIHFNDVTSATDKEVAITQLVAVVLSPENARDLHRALGKSLQQYEAKFGVIREAPKPEEEKPSAS